MVHSKHPQPMGRPKDFPVLFGDLVAKYKSKAMADKEYKTYMLLAKVCWPCWGTDVMQAIGP